MNKMLFLATMASVMASATVMIPTAQAAAVSCSATSSLHVVTVGVTATATLGQASCNAGVASCTGCSGMYYTVTVSGTGYVEGSISSTAGGSQFVSCSGVSYCSSTVWHSYSGSSTYCATIKTVAIDVTISCRVGP